MRNKKAFTLSELLVVVSIIAILATIITVSVVSSRAKGRDARVINNVSQLQISLEDYFKTEGTYPDDLIPGTPLVGVLSGITFLDEVPDGVSYEKDVVNSSYQISFELENNQDYLSSGYNCAVPQGILSGQCGEVVSPPTYTVTFDINGGDGGSTATQTLSYNIPTNLNANGFTRTGYTFSGWNTLANGSGTDYADGALYTIGAGDVTLYAKWTVGTYTVTYNANGSTGGTVPANQTKTHDVTLVLATNSGNLVKTGYTFAGWNTAANGSGTNYAVGSNYVENSNITLYARWADSLDEGGIVTTFGNYIIHTFLTSGTYIVNSSHDIDVLVVAGGGGGGSGGSSGGGGGGAGGLIYTSSHSVAPGNISIVVGAGGQGGTRSVSPQYGLKGSASSFGAIVASGGGGGAYSGEGTVVLASGGSGGGGAGWETRNSPGTGISGQGNNGGSGYGTNVNTTAGAGGGGGSSAVGVNGSSAVGGNGGSGSNYSTIFGTAYGASGLFAGGGGGAGYTTSGTGSAGGGNGRYGGIGYNATANTGSGGGGAGGGFSGGNGGSGIVIIRYLDPSL
ncbi:MAG: InlB B-repeat-containing protein [Patescibacteria group bacterium]